MIANPLFDGIHFSYLEADAVLTDAVTRAQEILPISSVQITYTLNEIPRAVIRLPVGVDVDLLDDWEHSFKRFPDNRSSPFIEIYVRGTNVFPGTLLFQGYVVGTSYTKDVAYENGQHQLVIVASSFLCQLQEQQLLITRYFTPLAFDSNPWTSNAMGVSWTDVLYQAVNNDVSIPYAVIETLKALCQYQMIYDGWWNASPSGAVDAYSVLNNGFTPLHSTDNRSQKFRSYLDTNQRVEIMGAIWVLLWQEGSIWDALIRFCNEFGFILIPGISDFILASQPLPPYGEGAYYNETNVAHVDLPNEGLRATPLRAVQMISEYNGGPWGVEDERYIMANFDLASYYSGANSPVRAGDLNQIRAPGWLLQDGTGFDLATQICRQVAIKKAFGHASLNLVLPYLSGVAPGCSVEYDTTNTMPFLGDTTARGVVQSTTWSIGCNNESGYVATNVVLNTVMGQSFWKDAAFRSHWLTTDYLVGATLTTAFDSFWI